MKTLILNTSDLNGGAARAAYRLHTGFNLLGISSKMLVQDKLSSDKSIIAPKKRLERDIKRLKPTLDILPLQFYRRRIEYLQFSSAYVPDGLAQKVSSYNPDIVHLHWINNGFLRIETISKFQKPIIWTLHDMWAFTGGCHYDKDCGRYKENCGKCPLLGSSSNWDLSRCIWNRKHKAWQNLNLTIVTPSKWLAQCARDSSLFGNVRIEVIPNGLDTQHFKPLEKKMARTILSLPQDKKLILFGAIRSATNKRKGLESLQSALLKLGKDGWADKAELVVLGASEPTDSPDFGLKTHYLGTLHDEITLSLLYSAADVFVLPSTQENLPNMVMEAMSCGTPCVAFNIGGMPDIIEHELTGYLAQPFETDDLAKGIAWVLEDKERWHILSRQARHKVEQEFELRLVAQQYLELFDEVC